MNSAKRLFPLGDRNLLITHPGLTNALQRCSEIVLTPDDTYLGVLTGPTGVGKSTVTEELVARINAKYASEMASDSSLMPAVYATQRLLSDKKFNWLATINSWLRAVNYVGPRFSVLEDARAKLNELLSKRQTQVFCVDEAGHIISGIAPEDRRALEAQADVLKSISEETKTKFLLVSSYTINPLLRSSGQLARRKQLVHFERYKFDDEGEERFRQILGVLDDQLSDFLESPLISQDKMIMAGCAGMVGVLRTWLLRAWANATLNGMARIGPHSLGATKIEIKDLLAIMEEARAGEQFHETLEVDEDRYAELLQRDRDRSRSGPPPPPAAPKATKRARQPKRPPVLQSADRKVA